jgi:hypothetical protein
VTLGRTIDTNYCISVAPEKIHLKKKKQLFKEQYRNCGNLLYNKNLQDIIWISKSNLAEIITTNVADADNICPDPDPNFQIG